MLQTQNRSETSKALAIAGGGVGFILLLIFILGFASPEEAPRSSSLKIRDTHPAPQPFTYGDDKAMEQSFAKYEPAKASPPAYANLLRKSDFLYYREAQMQLAVGDTLKANDDVEKIANEHKCEIVNLVIEGNDESRRCSVEFQVPSDQFDAFVRKLRKVGAVLNERITAQKIEGGRTTGSEEKKEFARVHAELVDNGARQGAFARSFDASGGHFVRGSAMLLEGTGYILPFLLAASILIGLVVLGKKFRRAPAN